MFQMRAHTFLTLHTQSYLVLEYQMLRTVLYILVHAIHLNSQIIDSDQVWEDYDPIVQWQGL